MDPVGVIIFVSLAVAMFLVCKRQRTCQVEECECECECIYDHGAIKPNGRQCISQNVYRNRGGKKTKVGLLVSCAKKGQVKIGYSLCCKTDVFDEREAYILASKRMSESVLITPTSIGNDIDKFLERCVRYYKGAQVPEFDGIAIRQ